MTPEKAPDQNGRIKLTWPQVVTLLMLAGYWIDFRVQVAKMETWMQAQDRRITALENRNVRVGFTQDDAEQLRTDILNEVNNRRRVNR